MEQQQFKGFDPEPKSWDFPMIINGWVHKLTGGEFKVLWYILRHTYGWQKSSDKISYSQFKYGIKKKNGTILDNGTGLKEGTLKRAIKGLVDKGFIIRRQIKNEKGKWTITEYSPQYQKPPTAEPPTVKRPTTIPNKTQSLINTIVSKDTTKSEYGNPDINYLINLLKEKFELKQLDGTIKENRNYCRLAINKFKKQEIENAISIGAKNEFWHNKITGFRTLYYNVIKITATAKQQKVSVGRYY